MKGKLKQDKGITLVALVITIIILLILAVVSIRLVMNDGIIEKAESAVDKYAEAEANELEQLSEVEKEMAKASGETITIDFEKLKSDVLANKGTYLAKAAAAGQNTTSNTDIGIGTDGSIINLNLWKYKVTDDNAIAIIGEGYKKGSYTGTDVNPVMPIYILVGEEILETKYIGETASNLPFCGVTNIESITIPDTVTSIAEHAFDSSSLKSITIPNSVTSIGGYTFQLCTGLTSIIIPDSITTIEVGTFINCSNLKNVTISNNLISIGDFAFQNCNGLTKITIPNKVTSIDRCAFASCKNLTSIEIPNSVRNIGDDAFIGCNSLTEIKIDNAEGTISGSPWGAPNTTKITYLR